MGKDYLKDKDYSLLGKESWPGDGELSDSPSDKRRRPFFKSSIESSVTSYEQDVQFKTELAKKVDEVKAALLKAQEATKNTPNKNQLYMYIGNRSKGIISFGDIVTFVKSRNSSCLVTYEGVQYSRNRIDLRKIWKDES